MASIQMNDGTVLRFTEKGDGPPLILVHGWNQTAALFDRQVSGLSDHFRVIALDLRGHGNSDAPDTGYRMSRHAMDLKTVIDQIAGGSANVLAHSMGCCVLWSYFDLFAGDGIDRAVFVDMSTHPIVNPAFNEQELTHYGAVLPAEGLFDVVNGLKAGAADQIVPGFIDGMVTPSITAEDKAWILSENARMAGEHSGAEFFNDIAADWRDVPKRINRPSLYIAGEASFVPMTATKWAADNTPGSQFESFGPDEGGNHFMFIENPDRFNDIVARFLVGDS